MRAWTGWPIGRIDPTRIHADPPEVRAVICEMRWSSTSIPDLTARDCGPIVGKLDQALAARRLAD